MREGEKGRGKKKKGREERSYSIIYRGEKKTSTDGTYKKRI